jgi:hypothetical protein
MNPLLLPLLLAISIPAFADTYTGTVSEVKRLHNGGIAVDLDGKYPREKKILYVPADDVAAVGTIPTPDTKGCQKSRFTSQTSGLGKQRAEVNRKIVKL